MDLLEAACGSLSSSVCHGAGKDHGSSLEPEIILFYGKSVIPATAQIHIIRVFRQSPLMWLRLTSISESSCHTQKSVLYVIGALNIFCLYLGEKKISPVYFCCIQHFLWPIASDNFCLQPFY